MGCSVATEGSLGSDSKVTIPAGPLTHGRTGRSQAEGGGELRLLPVSTGPHHSTPGVPHRLFDSGWANKLAKNSHWEGRCSQYYEIWDQYHTEMIPSVRGRSEVMKQFLEPGGLSMLDTRCSERRGFYFTRVQFNMLCFRSCAHMQ